MLLWVFLALFLPCAGMSGMFMVYVCLVWHAGASGEVPAGTGKGLSKEELEKLPRITGKELVLGTDCAVCLDDIEDDQPATLLPGCNHCFHVDCAHAWLSNNSVCPLCRHHLQNPC